MPAIISMVQQEVPQALARSLPSGEAGDAMVITISTINMQGVVAEGRAAAAAATAGPAFTRFRAAEEEQVLKERARALAAIVLVGDGYRFNNI